MKSAAPKQDQRAALAFFAAIAIVAIVFGAFLNGNFDTATRRSARVESAPNPTEHPPLPTPPGTEEIAPEAVFETLPDNFACPTEDLLIQAIRHAISGEKTLFMNMFVQNGGSCMNFPPGVKIRVLHVDSNQSSHHNIIEFNLTAAPNGGGMWAVDTLVKK